MSEVVSFKSGKDVGEELGIDDDARLTCSECGAMTTAQAAYESGWQLAPLVCPCCRAPAIAAIATCCHLVRTETRDVQN